MTTFRVGRREVGGDRPSYFVADIAANHDGDLGRAVDLVHLAAQAGADAAKFQNFRAETIVSEHGFRSLGGQVGHQASWERSVFEVYRDASIPVDWTPALAEACDAAEIDYLTAPYDLDLLDDLRPYVCAWKVGSGDITWHEALERLAADGIPVLLATGASDLDEVDAAMAVLGEADVVLMQCNTNYTGSLENFAHIELNVLRTFAERYPHAVLGLSDHTPGHATVLGGVALGARVFEKHFTDDRTRTGPDHAFSMEPSDWADMVARTRELELALGNGRKRVMPNEAETVVVQRRAIRAAHDIPAGARIARDDLTVLRPCPPEGLPPTRLPDVVGRITARALRAGDLVVPDQLAP